MNEYASKKKTAKTAASAEQVRAARAPEGIPNSSMEAIMSGRARASADMMGHRQDLAPSLNAKMSKAFGMDLSGMQIYRSNAMSGTETEGLASGNKIVLSRDVDLNTTAGQAILGHEISHVRAQSQGIGLGHTGLYQNAGLEHQADVEGAMAARGQSILGESAGMDMGVGMSGIGGLTPLGPGLSASAGAPMQASGKGKKNKKNAKKLKGPNVSKRELENLNALDPGKAVKAPVAPAPINAAEEKIPSPPPLPFFAPPIPNKEYTLEEKVLYNKERKKKYDAGGLENNKMLFNEATRTAKQNNTGNGQIYGPANFEKGKFKDSERNVLTDQEILAKAQNYHRPMGEKESEMKYGNEDSFVGNQFFVKLKNRKSKKSNLDPRDIQSMGTYMPKYQSIFNLEDSAFKAKQANRIEAAKSKARGKFQRLTPKLEVSRGASKAVKNALMSDENRMALYQKNLKKGKNPQVKSWIHADTISEVDEENYKEPAVNNEPRNFYEDFCALDDAWKEKSPSFESDDDFIDEELAKHPEITGLYPQPEPEPEPVPEVKPEESLASLLNPNIPKNVYSGYTDEDNDGIYEENVLPSEGIEEADPEDDEFDLEEALDDIKNK